MWIDRRLNRRALLLLSAQSLAITATSFWNRRQPSEWTNAEIAQLLAHSPWSKEVNAEFMQDTDYTANGAAGPRIGRGGQIEAPRDPAQFEIGRDRGDPSSGAKKRASVTVRWESAQPVREAIGKPLNSDFAGRYVLSVSGLPFGIMEKHRRTEPGVPTPPLSPAETQARMIEELRSAATLEAKGKDPEQAGIVVAAPREPGTYFFGFSKDLLPLDAGDREITFTLRTALMSVRAKFEPKEMTYRGKLAL
jgi:hypothetical protein